MSNNRAQIRHDIRKARNNLSKNQQEIAAHSLKVNFIQYLKTSDGKQSTTEKKRTKTVLKDFKVESSKRQ